MQHNQNLGDSVLCFSRVSLNLPTGIALRMRLNSKLKCLIGYGTHKGNFKLTDYLAGIFPVARACCREEKYFIKA